jgi:hypothetical protein
MEKANLPILHKKAVELLSLLHTLLVQRGNLNFNAFIYQMHCAVRTVNFIALTHFAVALAARFKLRATITISRQHLLSPHTSFSMQFS